MYFFDINTKTCKSPWATRPGMIPHPPVVMTKPRAHREDKILPGKKFSRQLLSNFVSTSFNTCSSTRNCAPHLGWETWERYQGWKILRFARSKDRARIPPGRKGSPGFHSPGFNRFGLVVNIFVWSFSPQLQLEGQCRLWGHSRPWPQTAGNVKLKLLRKLNLKLCSNKGSNFTLLRCLDLSNDAICNCSWAIVPHGDSPVAVVKERGAFHQQTHLLGAVSTVPGFEIFKLFGDELTVAKFGRVDCIQLFGLHFTIYYAMNIKHSVNYCVSAFVNTNVTMITGIVFKFLNSKPPHLICQLSDRRPGVKIYKNICKDLIYDNMCNSLMLWAS